MTKAFLKSTRAAEICRSVTFIFANKKVTQEVRKKYYFNGYPMIPYQFFKVSSVILH